MPAAGDVVGQCVEPVGAAGHQHQVVSVRGEYARERGADAG